MSNGDADHRVLQVCKVNKPNSNHWLRSYYLPTHGANTLYVEVAFTVRLVSSRLPLLSNVRTSQTVELSDLQIKILVFILTLILQFSRSTETLNAGLLDQWA